MKILVTGGTGRLAAELKKHLEAEYVGIENWDITYPIKKGDYDLIIHMAAYTDVRKAESEPNKCFQINAFGTFNMVQTYIDTPFIYISTEYANKPLGIYALSKRLGEDVVKTHPRHLILRTSFKPNPFPFPKAYSDQYTQGDYVDVIAKMLAKRVLEWYNHYIDDLSYLYSQDAFEEIEYLGTGRKTMLGLAKRTRPDVEPNSVDDYNKEIGMELIPKDYQ